MNAGRFKLYREDGSPECQEFWHQVSQARYAVGANQSMDFYVPVERGHDDFLMSAALAVEAASTASVRRATGQRRATGAERVAGTGQIDQLPDKRILSMAYIGEK